MKNLKEIFLTIHSVEKDDEVFYFGMIFLTSNFSYAILDIILYVFYSVFQKLHTDVILF